MAFCKFCDKEVEPVLKGNRYYCPDCNKYVKVIKKERAEPQVSEISEEEMPEEPSEIESEEEPEEREPKHYKKKEPETVQEGPTKLIITPKTIKYDAADLHMGEILVDHGFAKDLNELSRKNMKLAFSLMNMGDVGRRFNTMENQEPDPKRTMKEIQDQKLMEAYTKSFDSGNKSDPMAVMIPMFQMMMDNQRMQTQTSGGGQNSEVIALQRKIDDMVHQQEMARIVSKSDQTTEGQRAVKEAQMEIEKMRIASEEKRISSEERVKKQELETQKEREEKNQLKFDAIITKMDSKVERITEESKRKGEKTDFVGVKEKIDEAKEITSLVTGKKDAGTEIAEVAKVALPEAIKFGREALSSQKEQRAMQQQAMQYHMGQQSPPPAEQLPQELPPEQLPQELPPEQPNPEPNPLGLTETEKQMADQNAEMYIYTKDKKKQ